MKTLYNYQILKKLIKVPDKPVKNFYNFRYKDNGKTYLYALPFYSFNTGFIPSIPAYAWHTTKNNLFDTLYNSFMSYYTRIIHRRKDYNRISNVNLTLRQCVALSLIYFDNSKIIQKISKILKFGNSFKYIKVLMGLLSRQQRFLFEVMVTFKEFKKFREKPSSNQCRGSVANSGRPDTKHSRRIILKEKDTYAVFKLDRVSIILNKLGSFFNDQWVNKEYDSYTPSSKKPFRSNIMESLLCHHIDLISNFYKSHSRTGLASQDGFQDYSTRKFTL